MSTFGGYPTLTYLWQSTSHNGQVSGCGGGVVRLSNYVPISVRLQRAVAYSDQRRQTSWSMVDTALVALPGSLIYVPYDRLFTAVNQPVRHQPDIYLFI